MHSARSATLVLAVAVALPGVAAAEDRAPQAGEPAQGRSEGDQTQWTQPAETPPVLPADPVKALPVRAPAARRPSPYAGLRALSLREGEGLLRTAEGQERLLKPGDMLGAELVKAVDAGLVVLSRPAQPGRPGGEATVVIRFDTQGEPSVRVYHVEDPTPAEPRETP